MKLKVTMKAGRNLKAMDSNGLSDPYAVYVLNGVQGKTEIIKNTLNPVWGHHAVFPVSNLATDSVKVHVFDYDLVGKDELCGEVSLPIAHLALGEPVIAWYPLNTQGDIQVELLLRLPRDAIEAELERVRTLLLEAQNAASQSRELSANVEQLRVEIHHIQTQASEKEASLSQEKHVLEERLAGELKLQSVHEQRMVESQQRIEAQDKELKECHTTIKEEREKVASLREELISRDHRISALDKEISGLKEEGKQKDQLIEEKENQRRSETEKREQAERASADLSRELSEKEGALRREEATKLKLEEELHKVGNDHREANSRHLEEQEARRRSEALTEEWKAKAEGLENSRAVLAVDIERVSKERDHLREQVNHAEAVLKQVASLVTHYS